MAKHYSEFLMVKHSSLVGKGVYDGSLDQDSKLHIDPMLLRNSNIPEFSEAYKSFIDYFGRFYTLVPHVVSCDVKKDLFYKTMIKSFTFPELHNTGLGYSSRDGAGKGISGQLSQKLAKSAYDIIKAGIVDVEIFALMQFLEDGIGADRISDMTIHILSDKFLAYTSRVCSELGIATTSYHDNSGNEYQLPLYKNGPIYFIPETFLTELKMAHDCTEIDYVASYNTTLRNKVCIAIQGNWKDIQKMKKSEFREFVYNNKKAYNEMISYLKVMQTKGYDFRSDKNREYGDMELLELLDDNPIPLNNIQGDESETVYQTTLNICNHFKFLVEKCRMYRMMLDGKKYKRETDWQHLLLVVASSYLKDNGSNIDVSPETDAGAGELDFKFSHGANAKTIVELKLSDNPNLLHGYRTQLPQYIKAENGDHGIFIVIEIDKVNKKQIESLKKVCFTFENPYEIVYINAKPKPSASKSVSSL